MPEERFHILMIEDDADFAAITGEALTSSFHPAFVVEHFDNLSKAFDRLKRGGIDCILLDLSLGETKGLDTISQVHEKAQSVPIVVLTGAYDESEEPYAYEALKRGAQDYLIKATADSGAIIRALRYAIERKRAQMNLEDTETKEVLSAIPLVMIGLDEHETVIHWNAVAENTFGIMGAVALNTSLRRLRINWDVKVVLKRFEECLEKNQPVRLDQHPFKNAQGKDAYLTLTFCPMAGENKKTKGVILFGASKRKTLRESAKKGGGDARN